MTENALQRAILTGDAEALTAALATVEGRALLETRDAAGWTPLMRAVAGGARTLALSLALLEAGADPRAEVQTQFVGRLSVLRLALQAGEVATVARLIDAGAELHYDADGYDALLDAVHGRDLRRDPELLGLLQLLVARGARLASVTRYAESGLRVLSRAGRFDAVMLLLQAGAPEAQLEWTPLIRAVAHGDRDALQQTLQTQPDLEQRDFWQRSAWHVALLAGRPDLAQLLRLAGADIRARGRCGQTSLSYAVHSHDPATVRYLLAQNVALEECDDFGNTALMQAAELGDETLVELLLQAGARVDAERVWGESAVASDIPPEIRDRLAQLGGGTALNEARDVGVLRRLLAAGADPQHLSLEGRRALLGLSPEPDGRLLQVDAAQFEQGRVRRFGRGNPERCDEPFWHAMVRAGIDGYSAAKQFGGRRTGWPPVWCAQRYGQSFTFLPDGRIVQVGGEHEDSYDPDFCIYNDVFVHAPEGGVAIYGYPAEVFPPTDFHSATLVGERLWLVGGLGYADARRAGETPVFTLDTRDFHIEPMATTGEAPGWIYRHRARLQRGTEIVVEGGVRYVEGAPHETPLAESWVLELQSCRWRRDGA